MSIYSISDDFDVYYSKMSRKAKTWSFVGIVALLLLALTLIGFVIYINYQRGLEQEIYAKALEKSKQNYFIQGVANSNQEKKLQDLNLELAKLKNNTIELERMFNELSEEKVSLEEIRAAMELGISRTKSQLDRMQSSVNSIIDQRTKAIISNELQIQNEKFDTQGK